MFNRRWSARQPENLNLIPLMNLFVTMIPLLLLTAAFYNLGMVSVSVPVQRGTGSDTVAIGVRITDKGFELIAADDRTTAKALDELSTFIPRRGKAYDYSALSRLLERMKRRYSNSASVIVSPHRSVKYQTLIDTLDATRSMKRVVDGKRRRIPLFNSIAVAALDE